MNTLFHPVNRLDPCPCDHVEHNWTPSQRENLADRLDSAERYSLTAYRALLMERLSVCPHPRP